MAIANHNYKSKLFFKKNCLVTEIGSVWARAIFCKDGKYRLAKYPRSTDTDEVSQEAFFYTSEAALRYAEYDTETAVHLDTTPKRLLSDGNIPEGTEFDVASDNTPLWVYKGWADEDPNTIIVFNSSREVGTVNAVEIDLKRRTWRALTALEAANLINASPDGDTGKVSLDWDCRELLAEAQMPIYKHREELCMTGTVA